MGNANPLVCNANARGLTLPWPSTCGTTRLFNFFLPAQPCFLSDSVQKRREYCSSAIRFFPAARHDNESPAREGNRDTLMYYYSIPRALGEKTLTCTESRVRALFSAEKNVTSDKRREHLSSAHCARINTIRRGTNLSRLILSRSEFIGVAVSRRIAHRRLSQNGPLAWSVESGARK